MKRVLKANRVLKINDDQLESYMEQGYSEIDEQGTIINEAKKEDAKSLKKQIKSLSDENAVLKEENAALKTELSAVNK